MKESNSFERLVSTISQEERESLLKKLKPLDAKEEQVIPVTKDIEKNSTTIQELFQKESFFLKIFLYIKSLFTSENVDILYNTILLKERARFIEKKCTNLLSYKNKTFTTGLYNQIYELSLVAKFFKPYINAFDDNRSNFYIQLSCIVVPELAKRMDTQANPYNSSAKPEENIDKRSSFAKKVDEIINDITIQDKNTMLLAIRSVEWLSAFCNLPFEKTFSKFTSLPQSEYTVPFEQIKKELEHFAKVLLTGTSFSLEMFEAFYLSQTQKISDSIENLDTSDLNHEDAIKDFVVKSSEQIQLIKMFTQSVPIFDITRIAQDSILWKPEPLEKTDTWLIQLKNYWKKLFDNTWEKWLISIKKEILVEKMKVLIGGLEFPKLPYKPWSNIENFSFFQLESSLSFLAAFFKQSYPKHLNVLKEILLNGEFIQRDNKTEFTDSYNSLVQIDKSIHLLNEKLSFKGSYGHSFAQLQQEALITVQGQAKLKTLVHSLEAEIKTLITHFADACRSMSSLAGGILHEEKNLRYASLKNISEIWGQKNIDFRKQLQEARAVFIDALEIIKELDLLFLLETRTKN